MEGRLTPIDNSQFKSRWESKLTLAEISMGVSMVIFIFLFCVHQPWFKWNNTIDIPKWGTFGDFIGGIIGTACAYISVRLLVKNLKEQEKANEYLKASNDRSSEVYELQLVHENVMSLSNSRQKVLECLKFNEHTKGIDAITAIARDLYDNYQDAADSAAFEVRIDEARKCFDAKYITYRDTLSVYFRLLYQTFQVIWQSDLKGDKKALLSKMQRSQFTEDELLLLRYNCLTSNGEKMRFYVNQFNILKHLPLSHLLEFKRWVKNLNEVQRNRLDTECILLKKRIKNLLIEDKNKDEILDYSTKYQGKITISKDNRECHFELIRNSNVDTSEDITSMDKVLDKWDDQEIRDFFVDYFKYVFDYSNFSQFNKISELTINHDIKTENNGQKHTIWTLIRKDNCPLVVSMPQNEDPKN